MALALIQAAKANLGLPHLWTPILDLLIQFLNVIHANLFFVLSGEKSLPDSVKAAINTAAQAHFPLFRLRFLVDLDTSHC